MCMMIGAERRQNRHAKFELKTNATLLEQIIYEMFLMTPVHFTFAFSLSRRK